MDQEEFSAFRTLYYLYIRIRTESRLVTTVLLDFKNWHRATRVICGELWKGKHDIIRSIRRKKEIENKCIDKNETQRRNKWRRGAIFIIFIIVITINTEYEHFDNAESYCFFVAYIIYKVKFSYSDFWKTLSRIQKI